MRILFADKFPAAHLEEIGARGHDCVSAPDLTDDDLPAQLPGVDALVVRSTRITAATLAAASELKIVIRAGAGTNNIDKQAAAEKGVYVSNVPGKNAIAVAELALGLMLAIDRNIPDNVAELRAGRWNKKRFSMARGLYGRSLGIVGLGAAGLAVATRARAFGLHIHVIDKPGRSTQTAAELLALDATLAPDLATLAARCDILSFHLPAAAETKGLVGRALLAQMQPGAMLINTSRGDVVDEAALIEALDNKGLRAGLDVYAGEPASGEGEFHSALSQHPRVYGTHHIGASTEQAQNAVADGVIEILTAFAAGKVLYCVNGLA
ncbi:MAG: NAD(P)-binding domain-containing protein [Gammaproteobacteria bacterium]|nr:NAD(P)-binding domain-containing protein [Gammaproteobacteria bacterium]